MADPTDPNANPWQPTAAQSANLSLGDNPFLGQSNPYLQQNIDAASADMVRNYNLTTQPAFNAAMANSGSFGNAGVAQMNADAQNQLQKNLGNLSNSARMQDYTQQQGMYQFQQNLMNNQSQFGQTLANQQNQFGQTLGENQRQFNLGFDRNVYNDSYSQNMNNLTTGMGLLGQMNQYGQQDLTNANNQQNTPLSYWNQFSNAANSLGQGYGTNTNVTGSTSNPLAGMAGGAQLGSALQNYGNQQGWWGNSTPSSVAGTGQYADTIGTGASGYNGSTGSAY